jgi:hypothetical protein
MLYCIIFDFDSYIRFLLNVNKESVRIFFQLVSHNAQSVINDEIFVVSENESIEEFLERKDDYIVFDDE